MAQSNAEEKKSDKKKLPFYKEVDGLLIPGIFTEEVFRAALAYKPRPDDLFIATYPKCGTTWVQNIVACIFRNGKPFYTFLEFMMGTPYLEMVGVKAVEMMKRPGAIKVHLPYGLTPRSTEAKYIFVARNPKDTLVSFYHHTENIPGYNFKDGAFDDYFELFIDGKVDYGDYFDCLLSWYEHRNDPNVLFITYEQLKKDPRTYVLKIAEFMDPKYKKALLENDERVLNDVIHHTSFSYMKEHMMKALNEMLSLPKESIINHPDLPPEMRELLQKDVFESKDTKNTFFRKGVVGDWKNYFSPSQSARLEKKYRERTLGTDIPELWKDIM